MAVAVAKDGKVLWQEAFGLADREQKRAATPQTPYAVGSITKPLTATAVMLLRERGKINLDRSINAYLGQVRLTARVGSAEDATVRRVLSHTAGLPLHYRWFFEDDSARPPSVEDAIRCYGVLMTRPGEMHLYSNLGYGILGHMIAQVSGRSYAAFMRDEVFRPLGMTRTTVAEQRRPAGAAAGYGRDGKRLPFYSSDHPAASAVFTTIGDLVRFGIFHAGERRSSKSILTAEARREMQQTGEANQYGLGWSINDWGYRVVWHSGAAPGAGAALWLVPDHGIVIAVIGNIITAPSNQIAGRILGALLPPRAEPEKPSSEPVAPRGDRQGGSAQNAVSLPRGTWRGAMRTCDASEDITVQITDKGIDARSPTPSGLPFSVPN
jgi:CubicO group peptidase (beta-lactamase class C family)